MRRIPVPANRLTPLKASWMEILQPLVEHMKLQVRMNTKRRCVEIRMSEHTEDVGSLQKAADFVKAFMLGFETKDAIAMLRLDDLFIESFQVKDVKRLQGDHLSRCIGRLAGKDGKTKYAIENSTRTRIVLVEDKSTSWDPSETSSSPGTRSAHSSWVVSQGRCTRVSAP